MKISAGTLIYRRRGNKIEVLLVHPGGPFWAEKDKGAWSIPKGEIEEGEDLLQAAIRETKEELGFEAEGEFEALGSVKLKSGKIIHAWVHEGDYDLKNFHSNTFKMEWPPKSGKFMNVPENDKAEYFDLEIAKEKINPAQVEFLEKLNTILSGNDPL